ncbi:DUF488 family protein [Allosaccharopolyspora coralli]|uniref:DUF488 family protein n=1 Tax=Allosaccharopolyspora coralli TaxID=2665642 RepID=A0A5Q3Q7H9_9PSEU|nr:DUF488 domain-containing protein [Allosaccharopolyspora coralli]QGK70432.1 DUF488 family protein [Allosaccharopolyspora coralli]
MVEVLTFGHGTATQEEMIRLLHDAEVAEVVDVRSAPGSRRNPHVAKAALEEWLPAHDVGYRWEPRLGGFRKLPPDSPDRLWRNDSFRAYAAHMRTPDFVDAARELVEDSATHRVTIMCSETVWWRCHRRMIADFLHVAHDVLVRHLMHDGTMPEHEPLSGVRTRADGLLVYD